jgi:ABC-2 type transport system ATP-binding protein
MRAVVSASHLRKFYGQTAAMDDVSLTVEKGSIVGLIGPNGAGKTTTLKAILGLTGFEGDVSVLGMDPRRGRHRIMERVSFIADVGVLPKWMRVSEVVDYIEGVHPRFNRERCETILAETSIGKDKRVKQLSKGMVTQLHLALILSIVVELLVLDEPTLGLDILYRKAFFDRLLNDYFDKETSIIISTHQVDEISPLLTHLLFIDQGRIILDKPMDDLEKTYAEVRVAPDMLEKANAMGPIYSRELLGKRALLFENADISALHALGEVRVPLVSDLFIAKMQKGTGGLQ